MNEDASELNPVEPPGSVAPSELSVVPTSVRNELREQASRIATIEGNIAGARSMLAASVPIYAVLLSGAVLLAAFTAIDSIVKSRVSSEVERQVGDVGVALTETADSASRALGVEAQVQDAMKQFAEAVSTAEAAAELASESAAASQSAYLAALAETRQGAISNRASAELLFGIEPVESWVIVVSISEELQSANLDMASIEGAGFSADVYRLSDGYYVVLGPFTDLEEAQANLPAIKSDLNSLAYLIDLAKRCPQPELRAEGFYECQFVWYAFPGFSP